MKFDIFKKPLVATFVWAFTLNFIFWFWVNVIWMGSENRNLLSRVIWNYSYPQGIATGLLVPIFIGLLTAGLVFAFKKVKSALATKKVLGVITLSGLVFSYIPLSFLGLAGIMYIS